ncbi:MAG: hypothetical protein ACFFD1_05365 [Candidatus Thorarchaeota archaeon]
MQIPSLVIIGNHTQGLGIIRSAANTGLPIFVVNDLAFSSSRFSKYISSYIRVKNGTIRSLADSVKNDEFTATLLNLPVKYPSILMGINEDIVRYLHMNRDTLSQKYFIPDNPYDIIFDKFEFNNLLEVENRIPTFLLRDIDVESYKKGDHILKSRIGNKLRNLSDEKALIMSKISKSKMEKFLTNLNADELIVQKIVKSKYPIKSSCSFSINGKMIGLFQYEKIRQHPNQFGTGTYLRSIYDEKILELSRNILSKLNYSGISEIEFVIDEEDQSYKVIEMNPRTWKSINFSTQCGQNLVEKYIKYVLGKEVDSSVKYNTNYYWVDIFTDIPQMFREKRVFHYSVKRLFECMWSIKDPLPFITTALFSPYLLFKGNT